MTEVPYFVIIYVWSSVIIPVFCRVDIVGTGPLGFNNPERFPNPGIAGLRTVQSRDYPGFTSFCKKSRIYIVNPV